MEVILGLGPVRLYDDITMMLRLSLHMPLAASTEYSLWHSCLLSTAQLSLQDQVSNGRTLVLLMIHH